MNCFVEVHMLMDLCGFHWDKGKHLGHSRARGARTGVDSARLLSTLLVTAADNGDILRCG